MAAETSESELANPWAQQNRFEFETWLGLLRAVRPRAILEIGSCLGHSMLAMARTLGYDGRIVSVDLGRGAGDLEGLDTRPYLEERADAIRAAHIRADLIYGDSHDVEIVRQAAALGPFDACFIDGDHTTQGVALDWKNYGRFATVTALHDIANPLTGVPQFWQTLQGDKRRSIVEIVGSQMGIGVVFNAVPRGGFQGSEFVGWNS